MIKMLEGVIVSEVDYKESSKIINILTKEEGLIGVFARGCKRIRSPISSTTSILTYGFFYLNSRPKGLPILTEVDVIDSFKNIKKDYSSRFMLRKPFGVMVSGFAISINVNCKKAVQGFPPDRLL